MFYLWFVMRKQNDNIEWYQERLSTVINEKNGSLNWRYANDLWEIKWDFYFQTIELNQRRKNSSLAILLKIWDSSRFYQLLLINRDLSSLFKFTFPHLFTLLKWRNLMQSLYLILGQLQKAALNNNIYFHKFQVAISVGQTHRRVRLLKNT